MSDDEQAIKFADKFSEIPNQYQQLKIEDILTEKIYQTDIPQFKIVQVWWLLSQIRTNKSSVKGDISPKILKNLAAHIAEPLTHVYNASLEVCNGTVSLANMIDWSSAFVRQCPKLGVKSFQNNGVRNSLIPLLVYYFQDRHLSVKWRGITTTPRIINGGGLQEATLGIQEYLSQTNNSADCVGQEERFKFVDDLTILEIVNILTIGLSSIKIMFQVPNDMKEDNRYIPPEHFDSQLYLNKINSWTEIII